MLTEQLSLLEGMEGDEAADRAQPRMSDSQKSREGLSQVDTQSDLHFKYIPLHKQLVKCSFAYECGNCKEKTPLYV